MTPTTRRRSWSWLDVPEAHLPPDLTGGVVDRMCRARKVVRTQGAAGELLCTRLTGHTGRHAAGDGRNVCGVWS